MPVAQIVAGWTSEIIFGDFLWARCSCCAETKIAAGIHIYIFDILVRARGSDGSAVVVVNLFWVLVLGPVLLLR